MKMLYLQLHCEYIVACQGSGVSSENHLPSPQTDTLAKNFRQIDLTTIIKRIHWEDLARQNIVICQGGGLSSKSHLDTGKQTKLARKWTSLSIINH